MVTAARCWSSDPSARQRLPTDNTPAPDLQTRLFITLINTIGKPAALGVPRLTERQLKQRMEPSQQPLPPSAMLAIVAAP